MRSRLVMCVAITGAALGFGAVFAQGPSDDPFGGGFPIGYVAEIFTMGAQNDSLHGWGYNWMPDLDTVVLMGDGSFPESYQCGENRDIAHGDFDGDYVDELAVVWNRADGGVFVGIPTIDPATLQPNPAGWHLADPPIASGVLYATPVLADVLGEIRVVAGNFYDDRAEEFVLAYLAVDGTVTLTVIDVDSLTLIPTAMASISDQAVNTALPELQQFGAVSRFDIATGDFDGDGLDEVALVVNHPVQSPATDLVLRIYDYDPSSHTLNPEDSISYTANSDVDHPCLRSVLIETGNFALDSLDEIAILDSWSRGDVDSSRVGTLHTLKLTALMDAIDDFQMQSLPSCSWQSDAGLNGSVYKMITYNGELIVGGGFSMAGGIPAHGIARWDGTFWRPLGSGVNVSVQAMAVYEGALIVGGDFTEAGGVSASRLARWDGSSWETFGEGANATVMALLAPDSIFAGSLFACGDFTSIGAVSANRIARWDGSAWNALGSGLNNRANELEEYGNRIAVTGSFTTAGGATVNRIAFWLTNNTWQAAGAGLDAWGHALEDRGDGCLYIGGGFSYYFAFYLNNSIGMVILGLNGPVYDILVDAGHHNVIAAGEFTEAGPSLPLNGIFRWDYASGFYPFALGSGLTDTAGTGIVWDMSFYENDLIVGGNFDYAGGIEAHNIARWDGAAWHALSDSLPPMFSIGLAVGRFNTESELDDIAITACGSDLGYVKRYLRVYGVDPQSALTLIEKGETNISGDWNVEGLARSRRLIAIDDITGDGQADLAGLASQIPGRIDIYEPCDITNNCTFDPMPQADSWSSGSVNLTQLVLADLDTATVTIGPAKYYHVDSLVQPLAIINAPPVHYDFIDDSICDISKRYPLPPEDSSYDAYVLYSHSGSVWVKTETQVYRDWGISSSLESWISVGGTGVDDYIESEYGGYFDSLKEHSERITVGQSIDARNRDRVFCLTSGYDILEYPVLHSGELVGHILVATPTPLSSQWKAAINWDFIMPNHEVENIFSYPRDIPSNPTVASGAIGDLIAYETDIGSGSQWWLTHQTFENSSVTKSWDISSATGINTTVGVEFETTAEVSVEYLGVSAGVGITTAFSAGMTVGLGDYYDVGQISTFSTTFSETDSLHLKIGWINTAGGMFDNRRYQLTPYAYWAKNGALVIDYTVRPNTGTDPTWWQLHYSDPDPAFILPWRFVNEKEGASEPEESRHKTKEVFFYPSYPEPGDSMVIAARVHNFSLTNILDPVGVSFYLGNPDNGGMILHDKNSNDSIFYTRDTSGTLVGIDAQGYAFVTMMWEVPIGVEIASCQRIWGLIDPLDEISPEVHDNGDWATNNKGWNLLRVNTLNDCYDPDGDGWVASAYRCCNALNHWDNCPDVPNPDQTDIDGDGIGDACQIVCGDANSDVSVNVGDAVFIINYVFKQGAPPEPVCKGDANGDGSPNVGDAVYLINYVFKQGPPPVEDCCP